MYFNYHAKIKQLIKDKKCLEVRLLPKYNLIRPAMVFYFSTHRPMPVREYRWLEYLQIIQLYNLKLIDEYELLQ